MKVKYLSVLLSFFFFKGASAQQQELSFHKRIQQAGIRQSKADWNGDVVLATEEGELFKYDTEGKLLYEYKGGSNNGITNLDASKGSMVFTFSEDLQEYQFFDRRLNALGRQSFSMDKVGHVGALAPSSDQQLWLFDNSDFKLKKYSSEFNKVLLQSYVKIEGNSPVNLQRIREYQNIVFLQLSENELLLYDIFGNFLRGIKLKGATSIEFFGNELYYLKGDFLIFQDIYNGKERRIEIPEKGNYKQAIVLKNHLLFATEHYFDIYELNSSEQEIQKKPAREVFSQGRL